LVFRAGKRLVTEGQIDEDDMVTVLAALGPIIVVILGAAIIYRARELGHALSSYARHSKWTLWIYPPQFYPWLVRITGLGIILMAIIRVAQRVHFFSS
jgi:hypothetical protein